MNVNKIIMGAIGIMVAVVMVAGAFLPAVSSVVDNNVTFDNRTIAMYEMAHIDENTDYSLIWETNNPTFVTVNEDEVQLTSGTILCAVNDWIFRFGNSTNGYYLQPISTSFDQSINAGLNPDVTVNITVSEGTMSFQVIGGEFSDEIKTEPITDGYGIVANGKGTHIMKYPNESAYVLADSRIVGIGVTTVDGVWDVGFSATGTVADLNIVQYSGSVQYTISDETITSSVIDGYNNLSSITKYEFDVTNPNNSNVTHITYSYFIVPAEVTAEKTTVIVGPIKAMFNVLPIIVIAGLVMSGIYVFISRK